ncbi:uncharacterized protein BYT42DRAFT_547323 [Radiomyces spectabilis]|uniref:uncharacterized protein n=1 Tax=Radiomyces spectabilis TaxID=64574 RepID=UPI00221E5E13|nr:uncharacterized protein BYT42DRAFT_547323 [Radiomyces spectabilis]KAI8374253.1 hypothetical protein BYT42DRAFT_547323 [Radiomyces spectabilis]
MKNCSLILQHSLVGMFTITNGMQFILSLYILQWISSSRQSNRCPMCNAHTTLSRVYGPLFVSFAPRTTTVQTIQQPVRIEENPSYQESIQNYKNNIAILSNRCDVNAREIATLTRKLRYFKTLKEIREYDAALSTPVAVATMNRWAAQQPSELATVLAGLKERMKAMETERASERRYLDHARARIRTLKEQLKASRHNQQSIVADATMNGKRGHGSQSGKNDPTGSHHRKKHKPLDPAHPSSRSNTIPIATSSLDDNIPNDADESTDDEVVVIRQRTDEIPPRPRIEQSNSPYDIASPRSSHFETPVQNRSSSAETTAIPESPFNDAVTEPPFSRYEMYDRDVNDTNYPSNQCVSDDLHLVQGGDQDDRYETMDMILLVQYLEQRKLRINHSFI